MTDLTEALKLALDALEGCKSLGQRYRNDWSDFDGRTLRNEIDYEVDGALEAIREALKKHEVLSDDSPIMGPMRGRCEMSGHTPGPFTYAKRITDEGGLIGKTYAGEYEVGVTYNARFDRDLVKENSEILASTALFAAAPDLLSELKDAIRYVEMMTFETDDDKALVLSQMRAAVAKAEGKDDVR